MAPKRESSRKIEEQRSNAADRSTESSYERERRERIAANKVRLAELGVQRLVEEISQEREQKKKVRFEPSSSSPPLERRRSQRLRGEKLKNVMAEEEQQEDDDDENMHVSRRQLDFDDDDEEEEFVPGEEVNESDSESVELEESEHEEDSKKAEEVAQKQAANTFGLSEDELILQQALALSLGEPAAGTSSAKQPKPRKHSAAKASFSASAAELDTLYHTIVGGRRGLSLRELETQAETHSFPWSTEELQDMITLFDADKDGVLNLDEFRSISIRCQILQPAETTPS